jgi:uncharacterized protein involved in exopolysaccharide biosynthesis
MPVIAQDGVTDSPTMGRKLYALSRDLASRHYKLFLYVVLTAFVLIMGAALVMKKQYRSDMKYLVQNARSTAVLSSDRSSSSIVNGVTEEQLNSELEILQSEDVLSAVADPGWRAEDAKDRSPEEVRKHSLKIKALSEHLTVDPIAKEDVMSVSYLADSPQEAFGILSSVSTAYLARHEKLRRPTGASTFFVEQVALYEGAWKTAVQNLVEFQQLHRLVTVAAAEESLQRSIVADEEVLRQTRLKLSGSDASIQSGENIIDGVSPRQQTQQRRVPNEQLLQQLKSSLVGLNNRRLELLNRYKPSDRLVTELDQEIVETMNAIKTESNNQNVEDTTDVNPSWQQLKTSLLQEQVNRRVLKAERVELEQQLNQLRAQLAEIQGLEVPYGQLRSRADEAQSNYKTFVEKRDLARAEDAMDANKILNVTVMQTPTFHYVPVRPRPMLNLALGIPTALFLGIAVVYFAETNRWGSQQSGNLDEREDYGMPTRTPFVDSPGGKKVAHSGEGRHTNGAGVAISAGNIVVDETCSTTQDNSLGIHTHEEVSAIQAHDSSVDHQEAQPTQLATEYRHRGIAPRQSNNSDRGATVQIMTIAAAVLSFSLARRSKIEKTGVAR